MDYITKLCICAIFMLNFKAVNQRLIFNALQMSQWSDAFVIFLIVAANCRHIFHIISWNEQKNVLRTMNANRQKRSIEQFRFCFAYFFSLSLSFYSLPFRSFSVLLCVKRCLLSNKFKLLQHAQTFVGSFVFNFTRTLLLFNRVTVHLTYTWKD